MNPSRSAPASFRDRTNEFRSAVESARRHVAPSPAAASANGSAGPLDDSRSAASAHSEFNRRASKIGLGIHQTSQKLARLAKLAKKTSVFDDPTLEIQELTAVVKKDIGALNNAVMDLQVLCNSQNESGNLSKDTTNHSTTVVDNLKNRLMSATKEFKEVLTMRTENLKVHENRRQMFSSSAAKDASNPFIRQRPLVPREASDAAPPAPWASDSATTPLFQRKKTNGDHGASSSSSSSPAFMQQQQLAVQQDSYMQSRAEALQNVESTIHELSNIFTQLATMVSQQGELAIRIDENMEETVANVEGAQGQLLKYLNSISSNRWLMMKIFFVLMVFLMIFIFFVA
ncbi:syntaxin-32-like [Triticum dicoccoides]|uniref:syntaxin-32-like n=1 Tax=Triticum dicoccoides TaxID=85692 RepID=UPI00188FCF88|nr:syntaxin-32-like [Triticum dicoccoides]